MSIVQVEIPPNGRVDRALSVLLRGYLSQDEWNIMCDEVDEVLTKALKAQNCSGSCIFGSLIVMVLFLSLYYSVAQDPKDWVAITSPMFIVTTCAAIGYSHSARNHAKENIQSICEETSLKYRNLSFHFKELTFHESQGDSTVARTQWYIEIHFHHSTANSGWSGGILDQKNEMLPPPARIIQLQPMELERLENLDEMKNLLSLEEYEQKRLELLNSA